MSDASITVTVRVRPFSEKEKFFFTEPSATAPYFGDGVLCSPAPAPAATNTSSSCSDGIRLRPIRRIVQILDERVLVFDPPDHDPLNKSQRQMIGGAGKRQKDVRYAFDRVFAENASQGEVFEDTTKPLLSGILSGFNATVFAYGATGCGKTHTISGSPEDPGIIFLTMSDLFAMCDAHSADKTIEISLSYLEIYNETIRDLLLPNSGMADSKTVRGQGGLMLREDADKSIRVAGLSQHHPKAAAEVIDMIIMGNQNRTMSPTEANATSSRSHAVLQINVRQRARTADVTDCWTSATLSIIDLAGSERASSTKNKGARLTEGANINRSLLALGNCINALCDPHRKGHIPYRDSKLTRLLRFSLGGNCKTVMIVCVSPSSAHYDETHNTLKYGNRAKNIKTKVTRNTLNIDRHITEYVKAIYDLRQEVDELKQKIQQKSSFDTSGILRERAMVWNAFEELKRRLKDAAGHSSAKIKSIANLQASLEDLQMRSSMCRQWLHTTPQSIDDSILQASLTHLDSEIARMSRMLAAVDHEESISTGNAIMESARTTLRSKGAESEIVSMADREYTIFKDRIEADRTRCALETSRKSNALLASTLETVLSAVEQHVSRPQISTDDQQELFENVSAILKEFACPKMVIDYSLPPISPQKPAAPTKVLKQRSRYSLAGHDRTVSAPMSVQRERSLNRESTVPETTSNPSKAAKLGSKARRASLASFSTGQQSLQGAVKSPTVTQLHRVRSPRKGVSFQRLSTIRASPSISADAASASLTNDARKKVRWGDESGEGELEQRRTDSEREFSPSPEKDAVAERHDSLTPSPPEELSPPASVMRATNSIKRRRSLMNPNFFASSSISGSTLLKPPSLTSTTNTDKSTDSSTSGRSALSQLNVNSIPRRLAETTTDSGLEQHVADTAFKSPEAPASGESVLEVVTTDAGIGPIRNGRRRSRLSYIPMIPPSAPNAINSLLLETVEEDSPTVFVAGKGLGMARRVSADVTLQHREKENNTNLSTSALTSSSDANRARNQGNGVGSLGLGLGLTASTSIRLAPKNFESAADKLTKQYTEPHHSKNGHHRRQSSTLNRLETESLPAHHALGIEEDSLQPVANGMPGLPSGMSIKIGKPVWR